MAKSKKTKINIKDSSLITTNNQNNYIHVTAILQNEEKSLEMSIYYTIMNGRLITISFRYYNNNSETNSEEKEIIEKYRNDITEAYKNIDLKAFWIKKINENRYFNKCELEYIQRFYPDIYEQAKKSREIFLENKNNEKGSHSRNIRLVSRHRRTQVLRGRRNRVNLLCQFRRRVYLDT